MAFFLSAFLASTTRRVTVSTSESESSTGMLNRSRQGAAAAATLTGQCGLARADQQHATVELLAEGLGDFLHVGERLGSSPM